MSEIVVDAVTRDRLLAAGDLVLVKDESGAVLGQFRRESVNSQDPLDPGISWEELERRANSGAPTYSTAEVLAYAKGRVK